MVQKEQIRITVLVQSNATQNKVAGFRGGVLQVKIAAPPIKGKANQELVKFLSSLLGVSKSSLSIEKGMTSKKKTIVVRGLGQDEVLRLLERGYGR
ncbi:DUF167 domain-containing protein [Chloroflexota bacterium]